MLKRKLYHRGLFRLFAGLFAIQILAASFCLVSPELHAAELPAGDIQMSSDMASRCASDARVESGHANQDTACAHCDLPGELALNKVPNFSIDFNFSALMPVSTNIDLSMPASVDPVAPTGPPRSSSLLYQTTHRILI